VRREAQEDNGLSTCRGGMEFISERLNEYQPSSPRICHIDNLTLKTLQIKKAVFQGSGHLNIFDPGFPWKHAGFKFGV
jgi:hypothetical protein